MEGEERCPVHDSPQPVACHLHGSQSTEDRELTEGAGQVFWDHHLVMLRPRPDQHIGVSPPNSIPTCSASRWTQPGPASLPLALSIFLFLALLKTGVHESQHKSWTSGPTPYPVHPHATPPSPCPPWQKTAERKLLKPERPRACAQQPEKTLPGEACAPELEGCARLPHRGKARVQQ